MEKVFEIYIRTSPERLWEAITDPADQGEVPLRRRCESDWTPGSSYALDHPGSDGPLAEGRTWSSNRPAAWCRRCTCSGARTPNARAPPG